MVVASSLNAVPGGAGVGFGTVAEVTARISAADPSLDQLLQNHLGVVNNLLLTGRPEQQRHYLRLVLQGYRFGNAFSEARRKTVIQFKMRIRFIGDTAWIDGEKAYCTGALFAHVVPTVALDEEGWSTSPWSRALPAAELTAEALLAAATGAGEAPATQPWRADLGLAS